ncbi:protein D3-like [Sitodiplosis mosellana]|uniref:protein D3-like n=1 Tax=Sitodiplosis mosellana TaxID=263140 RepID=UPI0024450415|nr:protein D3-like [Sitodiplosis mosellana]
MNKNYLTNIIFYILLKVVYPDGTAVRLGNELKPSQIQDKPTEVAWPCKEGAYYTVLMYNPDGPSRVAPVNREYRHWLVVNIPENDIEKGQEVVGYSKGVPPKGSGLHRYVFLVFKQPKIIKYNEPYESPENHDNRPKTSAAKLAKEYGLGDPVCGNFLQTQYIEGDLPEATTESHK